MVETRIRKVTNPKIGKATLSLFYDVCIHVFLFHSIVKNFSILTLNSMIVGPKSTLSKRIFVLSA